MSAAASSVASPNVSTASTTASDLADKFIESIAPNRRIELDSENAAKGIGRLAVAIVNLLHELLERQAIRRMENGTLSEAEIERLGDCLMRQSEAIDELCRVFGIERSDLNLDLGPLGKLL